MDDPTNPIAGIAPPVRQIPQVPPPPIPASSYNSAQRDVQLRALGNPAPAPAAPAATPGIMPAAGKPGSPF